MSEKGTAASTRRPTGSSPERRISRRAFLDLVRAAGRMLRGDLVARLALALFAAVLLSYLTDLFEPDAGWTDLVFLVVVMVATLSGLERIENRSERRFWAWLAAAFGSWFGTTAILLYWPPGIATGLAADLLYALYFLAFIFAIECRPHRRGQEKPPSSGPAWPREGAFVAGLLVYFSLTPLVVDRQEYLVSAELLYLVLEIYLIVRLLALFRETQLRRWRLTYSLLALSSGYFLCYHIANTHSLIYSTGWTWTVFYAMLWNLQFMIFTFVARLRHWLSEARATPTDEPSREEALATFRRRTLTLTLVFPLIHFTIYSFSLLGEASRPARELIQLVWLLLLGSIALAQHWLLERKNRGLVDETNAMSEEINLRKRAQRARERFAAELEAKIVEVEVHNAEMERFTYTASHELKTPLTTVRNFLGLLEKDVEAGNDRRVEQDVDRIEAATERMAHLLHDLLELSRVGRLPNESMEVALDELAHEAAAGLASQISERGVGVEVAAGMPAVWGDRQRLLELLQNLLDNAVKFLGEQPHPRVEVGSRPMADETVYYVRDNGIGIDPRYLTKIFGLFDQLNQKIEGTGLGLALAKRIVEVHGGRIWAESEGESRGSTLCFTLPVKGTDLVVGHE